MAKTLEELSKQFDTLAAAHDELAAKHEELRRTVSGVNDLVSHKSSNAALSSEHVFSPSRKGLAEYEEARTKLLKQKTGERVEIIHLGKKIQVDYAQGRELLSQGSLI